MIDFKSGTKEERIALQQAVAEYFGGGAEITGGFRGILGSKSQAALEKFAQAHDINLNEISSISELTSMVNSGIQIKNAEIEREQAVDTKVAELLKDASPEDVKALQAQLKGANVDGVVGPQTRGLAAAVLANPKIDLDSVENIGDLTQKAQFANAAEAQKAREAQKAAQEAAAKAEQERLAADDTKQAELIGDNGDKVIDLSKPLSTEQAAAVQFIMTRDKGLDTALPLNGRDKFDTGYKGVDGLDGPSTRAALEKMLDKAGISDEKRQTLTLNDIAQIRDKYDAAMQADRGAEFTVITNDTLHEYADNVVKNMLASGEITQDRVAETFATVQKRFAEVNGWEVKQVAAKTTVLEDGTIIKCPAYEVATLSVGEKAYAPAEYAQHFDHSAVERNLNPIDCEVCEAEEKTITANAAAIPAAAAAAAVEAVKAVKPTRPISELVGEKVKLTCEKDGILRLAKDHGAYTTYPIQTDEQGNPKLLSEYGIELSNRISNLEGIVTLGPDGKINPNHSLTQCQGGEEQGESTGTPGGREKGGVGCKGSCGGENNDRNNADSKTGEELSSYEFTTPRTPLGAVPTATLRGFG